MMKIQIYLHQPCHTFLMDFCDAQIFKMAPRQIHVKKIPQPYFSSKLKLYQLFVPKQLHRLLASISLFSAAIFYAVIAICQNFLVNIVAISLYQFFCTFFLADIT